MSFQNIFRALLVFVIFSLFTVACDNNPADSDEHDHDHFEAVGAIIYSGSSEVVRYEEGVVTGSFTIQNGSETGTFSVKFIEEDGDEGVPDGEDHSFSFEVEDQTVAQATQVGDWGFKLTGLKQGTTRIRLIILHEDHEDFVSEWITITVQ